MIPFALVGPSGRVIATFAEGTQFIFKPCGTIITVVGLLLLVFDKWAWSFRFLHPWFVARPYIKGTWKGLLYSEYVDPKTNQKAPPIEVYLVIRQTYFTIHARLLTRESS